MTPQEHYDESMVWLEKGIDHNLPIAVQIAQVHAFLAMAADVVEMDL